MRNRPPIQIFKSILPEKAKEILKKAAEQSTDSDAAVFYMIRESNYNSFGVVSIDSFDISNPEHPEYSRCRVFLLNDGWKILENDQIDAALATLHSVSPNTMAVRSKKYAKAFVLQVRNNFFDGQLIIPEKPYQTTWELYAQYDFESAINADLKNFSFFSNTRSDNSIYDRLPEKIRQTILDPVTQEIMKTPVALTKDQFVGEYGGDCLKSHSYERSIIGSEKSYLKEGKDFYINYTLKNICDILREALIKNNFINVIDKIDEELVDSITQENIKQPILTPSGRSFDSLSIYRWMKRKKEDPIDHNPLTLDQLIHNKNLKLFIDSWPDFKRSIEQKIRLKPQ